MRSTDSPTTSSNRFIRNKLKPVEIFFMAIATAGLFDATLLGVKHYVDLNLPCTVTHGCETVLASKYAVAFGVPVAIYGVLFYLLVLIMGFYAHQNATDRKWLVLLTTVGFGASLYLLYAQAYLLHAWCQYCLISTFTSTVLFVASVIIYFIERRKRS